MEPKNYQSGAAGSAPAAEASPSNGFPTDGDPATSVPATVPGAAWFHQIGEELRNILVQESVTPDDADLTQIHTTIAEMIAASATTNEYIKLSDVKASGTEGGGFTSGAWQTRTLNTEDTDTGNHCSLSSNQFTLDAGTYEILATARTAKVNGNKLRLRNITDSADTLIGLNAFTEATHAGSNIAVLSGRFTIAASKTFELQHRCQVTRATNGYGESTGFGVSEVYAIIELSKVG